MQYDLNLTKQLFIGKISKEKFLYRIFLKFSLAKMAYF